MARFNGAVGYGETVETSLGVWEDVITERLYYGDVIRNSRKTMDGSSVNDDFTIGNSIAIVGDDYAFEHFFAIRYVGWSGSLWTVPSVEIQRPRIILRLGVVYNGPKA